MLRIVSNKTNDKKKSHIPVGCDMGLFKLRNSKLDLLISARRSQTPRHKLRQVPLSPIPLSPLITNFEKWSGKKKKIYIKDDKVLENIGGGTLELNKNYFAQLLAGPMRCDRITRLKLPKHMLMQLKLKKIENRPQDQKHTLELIPQIVQSKSGRSSYILNSKKHLLSSIHAATRWIPLPALQSDMRFFGINDVWIDRETFLKKYEMELQTFLDVELGKLKGDSVKLKKWNIVLHCSTETINPSPFEISRVSSNSTNNNGTPIIRFNLKGLDEIWSNRCLEKYKNHPLGIVLSMPEHREIINGFQKLLIYCSS